MWQASNKQNNELFAHLRQYNRKKWSTDICDNMNEFWKYTAKRKKPDIKDWILYGSIYMKCAEETNSQKHKDEWLPGAESSRGVEWGESSKC